MLTYLLEKLDKIKKDHALYCSTKPKTKEEETKKKEEKTRIKEKTRLLYDFICK